MQYRPLVLLLALASPVMAEPANFQYYNIQGNSVEELRTEMQRKGPRDQSGRRFHGLTDWHVSWTYRWRQQGDRCRLNQVEVDFSNRIQMPRWRPSRHAPRELVQQWQRYIQRLEQHELQHYQHGVQAAEEVERVLSHFSIPGNCRTMENAANQRAEEIIRRYNRLDQQYDRRTQHGASEGARF